MRQPKITIRIVGGHAVLTVVDTEVFDFIEDIFTEEHDMEWSYLETSEIDGKTVYMAHFLEIYAPKELQTIVDGIDQNELQRIWHLNN